MAASGFTPIQLYRTSTASAVPVNTNLADGELAINLLDERLYFKNSAGTVKLLAANITPIANGGTGTTTPSLVQGTGVTITGSWPNQTINATGTGGTVTSVGGTGTVNGITLTGTVTSSGNLTLGGTLSGVSLTAQVTGVLPVANGGTGRSTLTNNALMVGNATGLVAFISPGATGQVLTSNGTTWTSAAPSGGSSFSVKTANYTATSGDNLLADTSAGSFTITLPATPTTGSTVDIQDSAGTFATRPLTVGRNGSTIMGLAEDMVASTNGIGFGLVYNGSDWRIF